MTFGPPLPNIPRMFETLKSFLTRPIFQSAVVLPPVIDPKVPNKPQAQQSFSKRTSTSKGSARLMSTDRRTANLDILTLRNGTSTKSTIHDLAQVSPDLSASVYAYQRLVVSRNFTAVARNLDGTISPDGTALVQSLISRFNYLTDYSDGFAGMTGLHTLAEQLCLELRLYGSCALELVLDKSRVPNRLVPISVVQVEFYEDDSGYVAPHQRVNGQDISLDYPTFFYSSLDQDLLSAYSNSPMEAALQATLADTEFTNDLRRSVKKALHPRMSVSIDSEKFRRSIPIDVAGDADKVATFQENFISGISETVNGLEADDAVVNFDSIAFSYLTNGNSSISAEWEVLQKMINAKQATGTKAPSFVLGHGSGSQNVASSESLLFLRYAEGIQQHINEMLSRALTLAVRLLGQDVYVKFEFARIDLRPELECESFLAMRQSRVLMQLALGLIGDDEASIALTGNLPPPGAPKLSGTFFMSGVTDPNATDVSSALSNTGAVGQTLQSDAPKAPKGPSKNSPLERVK